MTVMDIPSKSKTGVQHNYIIGLNHISVHVRDVNEATAFWMDLFEANPYRDFPGKRLFHVEISGVVLAFFDHPGVIGSKVEFPHYAFSASPEGMRVLKKRLDDAGVKTHPLWTRNKSEALMYFRDPSGNLFELYCAQYDRPEELKIGLGKDGGDFRPPIDDLNYDWPKR
jgi:catechol 2,3-dioxygenase-like lactoylglutathione lyase family enzyme